MKKLRKKLIELDKKTNWHDVAKQCDRTEIQLRMRADIGQAIKRIEQETGEEQYVPDYSI